MAALQQRHAVVEAMKKIGSKSDDFYEAGSTLQAEILGFARQVGELNISPEAKRGAMESLLESLRTSLTTKHAIDAFVGAMKAVQDDAANGDFDGECGEDFLSLVQGALQKHIDEHGAADVELEEPFRKFRKVSKPLLGGDDDESDEDVCVDETQAVTEASLKCPISQSIMVNPMCSKKCGHSYSLTSVKSYFKKQQKCAVYGCSAVLCISDFKKDKETEVAIKAYKAKAKRLQASQRDDAVDMDDDDEDE